jgi:hypothetical protein
VHDVSRRALSFLESLRAHGVAAKMTSLQTVALPRGAPPGTTFFQPFFSVMNESFWCLCMCLSDSLGAACAAVATLKRQRYAVSILFPSALITTTVNITHADVCSAVCSTAAADYLLFATAAVCACVAHM